jgi:hypothetical protein
VLRDSSSPDFGSNVIQHPGRPIKYEPPDITADDAQLLDVLGAWFDDAPEESYINE